MDAAAWIELIRSQQPPLWRAMAELGGGRVEQVDDVLASIVPASPNRSVVNAVFYERTDSLRGALPRITEAYSEAGINAWTVWVPEDDGEAAEALEQAGHVLDAEPRAMAMELADFKDPGDPAEDVEISESDDVQTLARINEVAYQYEDGDFTRWMTEQLPDSHIYMARINGEAVGTGMTWERDGDAEITWIATLHKARGRGVGTGIMLACLRGAIERANKTTTLQASAAGRPVYERLGYRDFGALQMWERREPGAQ